MRFFVQEYKLGHKQAIDTRSGVDFQAVLIIVSSLEVLDQDREDLIW